ncbi:unnamed protein product [Cuscuta epithymum]|uniref:S-acyltransferase n=1 Tax=Cuscuta epithymum TaxID=186058 RepID=A0AAV0FLD5_9ASTE|nr:unnamed protein product [Cuscuta epithymum]CAH9135964.1 unnamed protein product [Cuscuta epithymum]
MKTDPSFAFPRASVADSSGAAAMKLRRFLSIPIISVLILKGVLYYVTVFIFIEDWMSLQSSAGSLNALIFTFFASLCVFCYFVCVLKDPGSVPSSYVPDVEEPQLSDQESGRIGILQARKCEKCSAYKPPRAHHCRICKTCILRMDHHCLWINNCVGHRNYKPFVLLVFYSTIASTYSLIMLISSIVNKDWSSADVSGWSPLWIFYTIWSRCRELEKSSLRSLNSWWPVGVAAASHDVKILMDGVIFSGNLWSYDCWLNCDSGNSPWLAYLSHCS